MQNESLTAKLLDMLAAKYGMRLVDSTSVVYMMSGLDSIANYYQSLPKRRVKKPKAEKASE